MIAAMLLGSRAGAVSADPATAPAVQPSIVDVNAAIAPTLITLNMNEVRVEDVLAELSRQSGYSLRPFNQPMWNARGNRQRISVNYQKQPFWTVLIDFCQKAQISPIFDGSPGRQMLFMPAGQMGPTYFNCPASDGGAILWLMTQLSRQNTITYGKNASNTNDFQGQMMVMFEPKLHVSGYGYQPVLEEAIDDKGNSLLQPITAGTPAGMNLMNRQTQATVAIPLSYPADKVGTKIVRLRGKLKIAVAIKTETIDFAEVAGDKEQTHKSTSGPRITLQSLKPMDTGNDGNNRQYILQVIIYRDSYDQQKFYDLTNSPNLRVTDNQNHELQFQGNRDTNNNGSEAHLSLMYYRRGPDEGGDDVGEPTKVSWEITTESKEISVPFEFKDLQIP